MPLAIDPTATIEIVLDVDKDKPNPPTFIYRHLTYRQWAQMSSDQDQIGKEEPSVSVAKQIHWLQVGLVGWRNVLDASGQPIAFDPQQIADMLTLAEAQEVLAKRLMAALPSAEDKKKSPSPSASDTAKSVQTVPEQPDVRTSPTT